MAILFYLAAIFCFCWFAGVVTAIILQSASLYRIRAIRLTLPVVGYATSNLIWWVGTFLLRWKTSTVLWIGLAPVLLAGGVLVKRRFLRRDLIPLMPARCDWPILLVILGVVALSVWPYLAVGMGNYFLINETDYFSRVAPAVLTNSEIPRQILDDTKQTAYLRDLFPLQLSSLTMLQRLFGCTSTDAASLQAIINLAFTALGVYWLCRYIFRFRAAKSATAALLSVAAQFYFHTYLNGHLGSLMYAASAPVFFGLCVWALARDRYRATVLVIAALWLFMGKAYPLVSFLLLPPLLLGKVRLLWLDNRKRLDAAISRLLERVGLSRAALNITAVVGALVGAVAAYQVGWSLFYPNRVSVIFNGYQPMGIVFDPQVFAWFFGFRLTQGFGYGFLEHSANPGLRLYDGFSVLLAIMVTVAGVFAFVLLRNHRHGSFLSWFGFLLPAMALAFALVWPFSYLVYKLLYVHYFLIVIGIVCGFAAMVQMAKRVRSWTMLVSVYLAIGAAIALNIFGDCKDAAISLAGVRRLDLADCFTLIRKVKALSIRKVTLAPVYDLPWTLQWYALRQEGIDFDVNVARGRPLLTAQRFSLTPIPERDLVLRSDKGKYVMSYTPDTMVQVYSPVATSTEERNGIAFRWVATEYDYTVLQFERYFEGLARYLKATPGAQPVFNDLTDTGYYLLVNSLLERAGIQRSDDPRQCGFFIRLNQNITAVTQAMSQKRSAVIAGVNVEAGKPRIGAKTYVDGGRQVRLWSNDLFELFSIPFEARQVAAPSELDAGELIDVIHKRHLAVADGIDPMEHEFLYLDDRMRSSGVKVVGMDQATAVLLCMPNFVLERERATNAHFEGSILWHTSEAFSRAQLYQVILVAKQVAAKLITDKDRELGQLSHRPIRAIAWPFKMSLGTLPELRIELFRFDRILSILFETGQSLQEKRTTMRVMREDGLGSPLFFSIAPPSRLVRIPLDHFVIPGRADVDLLIETDLHFPKKVMPYDDRLLLYRISSCELVKNEDPVYSESLKRVLDANWRLNPGRDDQDIIDRQSSKALALGTGWFPIEDERRAIFRWMSDGAEIVLEGKTKRRIEITGLPGPSLSSQQARVKIRLNGQAVASQSIDGRAGTARIILDCSSALFQRILRSGQNVFSLSTEGGGREISEDARVLNFRVFHIGFSDGAPPGGLGDARR